MSLPAAEKKKGETGYPLNPCLCVNPMLCETGGGGQDYPKDLGHDRKTDLRFWREKLESG